MTTSEKIKLWYRNSDIKQFNNVQRIDVFSDKQFLQPTTKIFELLITAEFYENNSLDTYSTEYVSIYLNDKKEDCIYIQYTLYNASVKSRFKPGYYVFPIINGSGKYLGVSGTIYIYVGEDLVRNLVLDVKYALRILVLAPYRRGHTHK